MKTFRIMLETRLYIKKRDEAISKVINLVPEYALLSVFWEPVHISEFVLSLKLAELKLYYIEPLHL